MGNLFFKQEQEYLESEEELLQELPSEPLEVRSINNPPYEDSNGIISSASFETKTNRKAAENTSQTASSVSNENEDADSIKKTSAQSAIETNKNSSESTSIKPENNQGIYQSTSITKSTDCQSTSAATETNQGAYQSTPATEQDSVQEEFSSESILVDQERGIVTSQETGPTLDGHPPPVNDFSLRSDPPTYHDIIPIIDDGSNVPPPPLSTFKNICFCFFDAYRLYYVTEIRNSSYMILLLTALIPIPASAMYMGWTFYDSCSVFPHTPLLLLIMGFVGVLLDVLRILTIFSRRFEALDVCEPPRIISEISVVFIICLIIAEICMVSQNVPVFNDPKNPLYCPELLHTYIFCMNILVPLIFIFALLLHIPMKPTDETTSRLQEVRRDALSQQQTADDALSRLYTAFVKPLRRLRNRRSEENSESNDSRSHLHDFLTSISSHHEDTEICISSSRRTEQIAIGGTVRTLQRDDEAISGAIGGVERELIGSQICDEGSVIKPHQMSNEEAASGGAVGGHSGNENAAEGSVGGLFGNGVTDFHGRFRDGGRIVPLAPSHSRNRVSLRSRYQKPIICNEDTTDPHSRNRESVVFTSRHQETITERTTLKSFRGDETNDSRAQKRKKGTKYGTFSRPKETKGDAFERKRVIGDGLSTEEAQSAETVIRTWRDESTSESGPSRTRWEDYGARPKLKNKVDPITKSKRKESTKQDDKPKRKGSSSRRKRKESTKTADKEDVGNVCLGEEGNSISVGGAKSKIMFRRKRLNAFRPENKEGAESGSGVKRKRNTKIEILKGAESRTRSKRKEYSGVEIKEGAESGTRSKPKEYSEDEIKEVAEDGSLSKGTETTESGATGKMEESSESIDRRSKEESEDN